MTNATDVKPVCAACGCNPVPQSDDADFCLVCRRAYPPSLLKACYDEFDYALKLSDGTIIRFAFAKIHGDYVTLMGGYDKGTLIVDQPKPLPFIFDRGIEVRLSEIIWCADAPDGS
jgi:hypothetical protein